MPWVEIVLAVLLLAAPSEWLTPVAAVVLLLMLSYTWIVAHALGFDDPVSCSCFGNLGRYEIDRTTVGRSVLLSGLAAAATWWAVDGGSAATAFGDLDTGGWWSLVAAAAAVLVIGLPPISSTATADTELLDYERQLILYGVVVRRDGQSSTLVELASTQARLLVVLSPGCGPSVRTAAKLDGWAAKLVPAVDVMAIYTDQASAHAAGEHAADLAVIDPDRNVRRLFPISARAAALVGADGFLAGGPISGEDPVKDFVADVPASLSEEPQAVE